MATFKTFFGDDVRRFTLPQGQELYDSLVANVKQLYGLPDPLFFQWTDEDGDTINVTNDLELTEAVRYAPGSLVRLRVLQTSDRLTSLTINRDALAAATKDTPVPAVTTVTVNEEALRAAARTTEAPKAKTEEKAEAADEADPAADAAKKLAHMFKDVGQQVGNVLRSVGDKVKTKMQEEADAMQAEGDAGNREAQTHRHVICDVCSVTIHGSRFKCMVCPDYDLCGKCEPEGHHPGHFMIRIRDPKTRPGAHAMVSPFFHMGHFSRRHGHGRRHGRCRRRAEAEQQAATAAAEAAAKAAAKAAREAGSPVDKVVVDVEFVPPAPASPASPAPASSGEEEWVEVSTASPETVAPETEVDTADVPATEAETPATVAPVEPSAPYVEEMEMLREVDPYAEQTTLLREMGFEGDNVTHLIHAYEGNIERVLSDLL